PPELAMQPGETLILDTVLGAFTAQVTGPAGPRAVGYLFRALDGGSAQVPLVAVGTSTWVFRAGSGFTDGTTEWSAFDEDTFDLPVFSAQISWTVYTPLTFDVTVPYFLAEAVQRLRAQYGFSGPVFTNQGLPREQIQGVVDANRAAGVRGRLRFSLSLPL